MTIEFKSKLIRLKKKQQKALSAFTKLRNNLMKQNEQLKVIADDAVEAMLEYQEVASNAVSMMQDNELQIEKINMFLGKEE